MGQPIKPISSSNILLAQLNIMNHLGIVKGDQIKDMNKSCFLKNIAGISNFQVMPKGFCHGLTSYFLFYAHAGYEKTYIKELSHALKYIEKSTSNVKLNTRDEAEKVALATYSKQFMKEEFIKVADAHFTNRSLLDMYCILTMQDNSPNNEINDPYKRLYNTFERRIELCHQILISSISPNVIFDLNEIIKKVYLHAYSPKELPQKQNNNLSTEFNQLIEKIKKTCSTPENNFDIKKIPFFLNLVFLHHANSLINKSTLLNKSYGIQYNSLGLADSILGKSSQTMFTLKTLKQHINQITSRKEDMICRFDCKNHSMGFTIKYENGIPIYSFYEPNLGLYVTNNNNDFHSHIELISEFPENHFSQNENGEKTFCIYSSTVTKGNYQEKFKNIKEPKIDMKSVENYASFLTLNPEKLTKLKNKT